MLEAIIFDMDGVIIDSEPFFLKAENDLLKRYGHDVPLEFHYQFQGTTHDYMWQAMKDEYKLEQTVPNLVEEANVLREQLIEEEGLKAIPGVLNLIKKLSQTDIPLAVASSSPMKDIEKTIKTFDLENIFTYLVSGESVDESKPAPDIFLDAADHLNVKPENCVVIEDSKNGVLAGRNAGMKVIGFYNQNFPPQDLSKATTITSDFNEVDFSLITGLVENN